MEITSLIPKERVNDNVDIHAHYNDNGIIKIRHFDFDYRIEEFNDDKDRLIITVPDDFNLNAYLHNDIHIELIQIIKMHQK